MKWNVVYLVGFHMPLLQLSKPFNQRPEVRLILKSYFYKTFNNMYIQSQSNQPQNVIISSQKEQLEVPQLLLYSHF